MDGGLSVLQYLMTSGKHQSSYPGRGARRPYGVHRLEDMRGGLPVRCQTSPQPARVNWMKWVDGCATLGVLSEVERVVLKGMFCSPGLNTQAISATLSDAFARFTAQKKSAATATRVLSSVSTSKYRIAALAGGVEHAADSAMSTPRGSHSTFYFVLTCLF